MKQYVVITTCLIEHDWKRRMEQYIRSITQTIQLFRTIPNTTIIIVENTGKKSSFLDNFGIPVLYTNTNNEIETKNRGIKEILDIFKVIEAFKLQEDDFLIKITGRYFLHNDSKFLHAIETLHETSYDVVCRYGGYNLPKIYMEKFYSVFTGIIGMRVKYVKQIQVPDHESCIEWKWAEVANTLDESRICMLDSLGLSQYIRDGEATYS